MVALQSTTPSSPVSIPPLEPYRPTLTAPLDEAKRALELSTRAIHGTSVFNVFHKTAGWVGQYRSDPFGVRVTTHDGRVSDHWTLLSAFVALAQSAKTRVPFREVL